MDIRRLHYFKEIVEAGTISAAAQRLNMAQPPLSQQLKLLEQELNMCLFERQPRKLRLTAEGEVLYRKAQQIFALIDETTEELHEVHTGQSGLLRIGMIPSISARILPPHIRRFQQQCPQTTFKLWEGDSQRITELVDQRIVDIGIVRTPVDTSLFHTLPIPAEPLVLALHQEIDQHPTHASIPLHALSAYSLLVLKGMKGQALYQDAIDDLYALCEQQRIALSVLCESNNMTPLLNWASEKMGAALLPASAASIVPTHQLRFKTIAHEALQTRPAALIWRKERYIPRHMQIFLNVWTTR